MAALDSRLLDCETMANIAENFNRVLALIEGAGGDTGDIESRLKAVEDEQKTLAKQSEVSSLQSTVEGVSSSVSGLESQVQGLSTSISGLESRVEALENPE